MTAAGLNRELEGVGQKLGRWQAQWWAAVAGAAVLALLWLLCWSDILLQFGRSGRVIAWAIVLGVLAAGAGLVWRSLAQRRSPEAVAARIEQTFHQLDNHLINTVQFAGAGPRDSLADAYVRRGVPEWSALDLRQLKNRRRHAWAMVALGIAAALMLAPWLWTGRAWTNALCRIANPFSQRSASTLANILDVRPGNGTLDRGAELVLDLKATGKSGQEVTLELWPADDKSSTIKLGRLTGAGTEEFTWSAPKMTSNLKYRFRAGDARSERFGIVVQAPLAFTRVAVTVKPPDYTKLKEQNFDGLTEEVVVPEGATLSVAMRCNRPLAGATAAGHNAEVNDGTWTARTPARSGTALPLSAVAKDGATLALDLKCRIVPDKPPVIRVLAPTARTVLAAGASPAVQWEVNDDYGLAKVAIQTEQGDVIQEWPANEQRSLAGQWTGPTGEPGKTLSYRIVAQDRGHRSRSPLIVFDTAHSKDMVADQAQKVSETAATLEKIVELQRKNLEQTSALAAALDSATPSQWSVLATAQGTIRQMTGQLLINPLKPLGAMTPPVVELYQGTMLQVVDVLGRVANLEPQPKLAASRKAIDFETHILRVLTMTKDALPRVEKARQITGVLALLDALVAGQTDALTTTKALVQKQQPADAGLVQKQDKLSSSVTEFIQVCRTEAQRLERGDAEFSKLIAQVGDGCEKRKVSADMLRAAEQLESKETQAAVPFEERALTALKEFEDLLNQWRVREAKEEMADLKRTVNEAREKFAKLLAVQSKIVETMRIADQKKDLSKEDKDEEQEELQELKTNVKDAALKVADDLHIFPELPVGNETVKDIYQVFEESKQVPGSDKAKAEELGLQKEDALLAAMENIKKRFDDMEMWLSTKPDNVKRLTENFDQQEMPKMGVIPLPKEIEDIIGELMKQEQDIKDKAGDSATNQALPDAPMGWDVAEGETSTFSGKGKSGNETPQHKEQDGRSLVGRQGMSDGETVAGSGKINQGDDKIEARRTKDSAQGGSVKEEGHADAKATGGGKQSGFAEESGMFGEGPRRDSNLPGSPVGMQAMLRRNAEATYARASLLHVRTGSLDEVVRAMQDAEDAMAKHRPAQQVREYQRRAIAALKKTQAELGSGVSEPLGSGETAPPLTDQMAGVPDEAPANYRDLVSEYFKALSSGEK